MIEITATATCDEYGCLASVEIPPEHVGQPFHALARLGWRVDGDRLICPADHSPAKQRPPEEDEP